MTDYFPHDPDYLGTDADHLPIVPVGAFSPDASQEDPQPMPTPGAVEPGIEHLPPAES